MIQTAPGFLLFFSMMPREMLLQANISRILGIGSALTRNPVLQSEVRQCYQLPVVFVPGGDAAWGAAVAVHDHTTLDSVWPAPAP